MPFLQKILKSKHNDFPEYYTEIELKNLTYKWDNVPVNEWIEFAEEYKIPYKNLYDDLSKKGLLYPVIVRETRPGIIRKWHCGGRRIIWAKINNYTHISAYKIPNWQTEESQQLGEKISEQQFIQID